MADCPRKKAADTRRRENKENREKEAQERQERQQRDKERQGAGPPKQEVVDNTPSNNASDMKPAAQGNLYPIFSFFLNGSLVMIAVFVFPLARESRSDVCKLGH